MKLYLSGPMSDIPAFNIPAFDAAAERLRSEGHEVVSPAELDDPAFRDLCLLCKRGKSSELADLCYAAKIENSSWGELLARDVKLLADDGIEGIVVLPGWTESRGALLETFVGRLCGLPVYVDCGTGIGLEPIIHGVLQAAHGAAAGHINGLNIGDFIPIKEGSDAPFGERCTQGSITVPETSVFSQTETRVTDAKTGGQKGSKPERFDLIPWKAMNEVARVYAFGATKYAPNNWRKGFAWSLCIASAFRHLIAFVMGEKIDPETKCHHLASMIFHGLTLMEFEDIYPEGDDRAVH